LEKLWSKKKKYTEEKTGNWKKTQPKRGNLIYPRVHGGGIQPTEQVKMRASTSHNIGLLAS